MFIPQIARRPARRLPRPATGGGQQLLHVKDLGGDALMLMLKQELLRRGVRWFALTTVSQSYDSIHGATLDAGQGLLCITSVQLSLVPSTEAATTVLTATSLSKRQVFAQGAAPGALTSFFGFDLNAVFHSGTVTFTLNNTGTAGQGSVSGLVAVPYTDNQALAAQGDVQPV